MATPPRQKFNDDLKVEGSEARKPGWRDHCRQGADLQGNGKPVLHLTKTTLHPFEPMT